MRACDRCHQIKEKCNWGVEVAACRRCSRLSLECHTTRPQRRAGRRRTCDRRVDYRDLSTAQQEQHPISISSNDKHDSVPIYNHDQICAVKHSAHSDELVCHEYLSSITDVTPQELYLLSLALGDKTSAGRYVIGPSFHEMHQISLLRGLRTAPSLLMDAFISCSTLIAADRGIIIPAGIQKDCQKRAAVGVSLLRAAKIENQREASTCLLLGLLLVTFAKYVAEGEVLAICRYTLSQVKPFYGTEANFDDDDKCFLKLLVLTETVECLFQAEIPVLRLECNDTESVDRFLGFSSPLLARLHSLADLNYRFRFSELTDQEHLMRELDVLESDISAWTPAELSTTELHLNEKEIFYILTQAQVLRETMLLIALRLRYPYGMKSADADALSDSISGQLESLKIQTGQTLNVAGLSLMTTAFELDHSTMPDEAFDRIERLTNFSPYFRNRLRSSLLRFWAAKHEKQLCTLRWCDVSAYYLSPLS